MTQPILRCLLLLHAARGLMAQVQLKPTSATVLLGSNVTFNCSVQRQWVAMAWLLKGDIVLTITKDHGSFSNDLRYEAHNYSTAQVSTWALTIIGVRQNDTGPISCDVQNIQKQTGFLDVQESGTVAILGGNMSVMQNDLTYFQCQALGWRPAPTISWAIGGLAVNTSSYNVSTVQWGNLFNTTSTLGVIANHSDSVECQAVVSTMSSPLTSTTFMSVVAVRTNRNQTVLIAVTVSIALLVIIVIIIIIVVFCCKRKNAKKSSYEDEVRKTRSQPKEQRSAADKQGMDNLGYADNHSGVIHSQFNDSGFSQPGSISTLQTPCTSCVPAATNPGLVCTHHSALKKYRQATIV